MNCVTRYVILGAGGVGGTIGGLLAHAGHQVVLIARGAHLAALRSDGLRLATPGGVLTPQLSARAVDEFVAHGGDVLVLASKVQDSAELLSQLHAPSTLPVVCAQNGVEGERIALRRFRRVYGVCVMLPASHLEPGHVVAAGSPRPGSLDLGRYPAAPVDECAEEVAAALRRSGFLCTPREDVMPWKRAKLLRNVGNSIEALGGHDEDETVVRELSGRARAEAEAALSAAGLAWTSDEEWDAYRSDQVGLAPVEGAERLGGSSWQSAARGLRSTEADYLNGEIVLLGRLHGVPTPVNELLRQEANALVRRGDPPGSVDLAMLVDKLQSHAFTNPT
jgi:2-dehydropantoate 2-reductase